MGEGAGEVLSQGSADLSRKGPRRLQLGLERARGLRQPKGLELCGISRRVLAEEHEVTGVRDQDQPVETPVFADLVARCGQPGVVTGGLDLQHPALRDLALARLAFLHLFGRVETEVRMARALLGQLADAEDLGFERAAHRVQ